VRADANNLWPDAAAASRDLASLEFPFDAVEEPIRAGDYEGLQRIASALGTSVVLDESLVRAGQLDALDMLPGPWIVNLRVSKMGGLLRSLEVMSAARARGLRIVVGAHVGETSLLTRAALTVANCARDLLAGQEGAFGTHLLVRDVVDPPIMFGRGGRLDAAAVPSGGGGFSLELCMERDGVPRGGQLLDSSPCKGEVRRGMGLVSIRTHPLPNPPLETP
jgi:L-alanine-DL-glutamate epimerase-like enolase superfamily enzyme